MKVLSVDLGATNGKVVVVSFDGRKIHFREVKRFRTQGVFINNKVKKDMVWNVYRFYEEIREIILNGVKEIESVGVDSWGVDFALLDDYGRVVGIPYHYRDGRTEGIMNEVIEKHGKRYIYEGTGAQFMPINTVYQLYSMIRNSDPFLKIAKRLLMIADLFNYWLSGVDANEYTLSTTTQLFDIKNGVWNTMLMKSLEIPDYLFSPVVKAGTVLGNYVDNRKIKVVATATHDTASAIVAIPFKDEGFFISSGTWSLIGIELEKPLINDESLKYNIANEGGFQSVKFLKNVSGMWMFEECNKEWKLSYEEALNEARNAKPFVTFFDPDDEYFMSSGNMLKRLRNYLIKNNRPLPESTGEFIRTIFENIAFNYRWVIETMENLMGKMYNTIYIIGGAARNDLLNQFTANVTGKNVIAGPFEAASIGNALVQLIAMGVIRNKKEAREIVKDSFELKEFYPIDVELWSEKYNIWKEIVHKKV